MKEKIEKKVTMSLKEELVKSLNDGEIHFKFG